MPSDYQQIKRDNMLRRGEEFDDIGRFISEKLYSDRTHFIFELLQNAEDALARRFRAEPKNKLPCSARFRILRDRLEFRHFGHLFDEDDVRAITDVLKGTKRDDIVQIGKFGIGFKSVYTITSTPEIHSGDEHFMIERYIRPRYAEVSSELKEGETLFIFPFNHDSLSTSEAFDIIANKLRTIGSRVLLFLKRINEIKWEIEGYGEGHYLRDSENKGIAEYVTVLSRNEEDQEENWILFSKTPEPSSKFENYSMIEVAFRIERDLESKKDKIVRLNSSQLVVYFPTEKETHLGFLIQGPYRTTSSRDNILEYDELNKLLIQETGIFLRKKVLFALKEMGLISVSLLESLPITKSDFPKESIFRPIYDNVREAIEKQKLLPTESGGYVAGKDAVLARGKELVELISREQLASLCEVEQPLEWLTTEITENKQELYRYLVGSKPRYWESEEITEPLIYMEFRRQTLLNKLIMSFLEKQDDDWIVELYLFFANHRSLHYQLSNVPIIRLQDGSQKTPFDPNDKPNAYLPTNEETSFPIIKADLIKNEEVLEFLKGLGIPEIDIVAEVFENVIPKYDRDFSQVSTEENERDMERILRAYSTDSQEQRERLLNILRETPFVVAENIATAEKAYKTSSELYQQTNELLNYFEGNNEIWFVDSEYNDSALSLIKKLGAADSVRIQCRSTNDSFNINLGYANSCYKRGVFGFDPDITVDGLEYAIRNIDLEKSYFIWNSLAINYKHCIRGIVITSSRRDFSTSAATYEKKEIVSKQFGELLIETEWLPDSEGNFRSPNEISLEDLPESFKRDDKLAEKLGMKKDIVGKLAEEAGISQDTIDLAIQLERQPLEFRKEIESLLSQSRIELPEFPEKVSANPDRRLERMKNGYAEAPSKE